MKNKKILMIISIITLISFIIGFSYAYFTTIVIGNDTASSNITTSGSLKLTYNGTDYISLENSQPGATDSMTFTVTNTGSLPVTAYTVNFSNVINTFAVKSELVYEIECTSSDAVTCLGKSETQIPSTSGVAITQGSIAPGTTHTYTLTVTFIDTGLLQDYNQGKSLMFKITINEQFDIPTIIAAPFDQDWWTTTGYFWEYKSMITSITFEDGIDIPVGAIETWDVSEANDGSIMAYIIDDGLGSSTYELFIQTNNGLIMANPNSSYLFSNFTSLTTITNFDLFFTDKVTNMYCMFSACYQLINIDLSSFNTSLTTDMGGLFSSCISLISIDLSNFNTSNVISMANMFIYCSGIIILDLSLFDTTKVTSMSRMFEGCSNLVSLDLTSFDTSSVYNMGDLFSGCSDLVSVNLSTFDTSNVETMFQMFIYCNSLISLDLSNFDTSNVTEMMGMFSGCSGLTSLDLSTFDTSNVTNMYGMFSGCSNLASLNLGTFITTSLTRTGGTTIGNGMFEGCTNLTNLDLRNADFTIVTIYGRMFLNITNGINIVVKDVAAQTWITSRLTDAGKTGTVTIFV